MDMDAHLPMDLFLSPQEGADRFNLLGNVLRADQYQALPSRITAVPDMIPHSTPRRGKAHTFPDYSSEDTESAEARHTPPP